MKVSVLDMGYLPVDELLVREGPQAPRTTQATAVALGYPLELDGKTIAEDTIHSGCKTEKSSWK